MLVASADEAKVLEDHPDLSSEDIKGLPEDVRRCEGRSQQHRRDVLSTSHWLRTGVIS